MISVPRVQLLRCWPALAGLSTTSFRKEQTLLQSSTCPCVSSLLPPSESGVTRQANGSCSCGDHVNSNRWRRACCLQPGYHHRRSGRKQRCESLLLALYTHSCGSQRPISKGPASAHTPARVPEIITIGMTNAARGRVLLIAGIFGSNYGPELDFFGPGQDIVSADYRSDTGFVTKTGTSMATPITVGLICYLRSIETGLGTPDAIRARLAELALNDVVSDPKGSPNRLINNGSGL